MKEDWIECKLDDIVSSFKRGPFGGDLKKSFFVKEGFAVYEQQHAINNDFSTIRYFIDEERFKKLAACEVKSGDYIISCSGTMGKIARLPKNSLRGIINQALLKINLNDSLMTHEYFVNYFRSKAFQNLILGDSRGSGIQNISGIKEIKVIPVLLPPLPIQRAIVAKIEALFSDLDNGIANFKTAQEQLKVYRQAVLKKAFEGELTKEWREKQTNLPTAEELLKQIKEERQNHYNQQLEDWKKAVKDWEKNVKIGKKPSKPTAQKELPPFSNEELEELPELPIGWTWCKNENYLFEVKDGTHDTPKYYSEGIPFITQKNIKNNNIDFSNVTYISLSDHQNFFKRSNVENGDIIIAMIGHGRGNCCIVKTDKVFSIKNVGLFKFFKNLQSNKFSLHYYQSTLGLNLILKSSKGGAQPFIGLTELRNWAVPVCSLSEQTQIVQEIESRLSVCDKMEQSINESIAKAEALRQSILKKAFEGKLLSEAEIAQCKQATDYEPASELLKKIQAEKLVAAQDKKQKTMVKKK